MNILIESYLVGFKIVCIKSMILHKNKILIIYCICIINSASSKIATCIYFSFIFLSLQFLF